MSGIPTIPVPTGGIGGGIGPEGVSLSVNLTLDKCNARPIFIYVVAKSGNIWRVFDPLSPTEKLPVWKEWTDEITHVTPTWKKEPIPPPPPPPGPQPPPQPTPPACIEGRADEYVVEDTFRFDEPGRHIPVGNPAAFSDACAGPDPGRRDGEAECPGPRRQRQ